MKLKGKVAVVTGGARDLGRAISVKLAKEGAKIVVNYFDNAQDAEETQKMIKDLGGESIAVQGENLVFVTHAQPGRDFDLEVIVATEEPLIP